jgi:hypothetical protein
MRGGVGYSALLLGYFGLLETSSLRRIFISAALPEEILFRGYVLRHLERVFPFWQANLFTAALFLAIHVPGWAYYGIGSPVNALSVFIVGLICGALTRRSNSVWSAVAFHMLNNLAALITAG